MHSRIYKLVDLSQRQRIPSYKENDVDETLYFENVVDTVEGVYLTTSKFYDYVGACNESNVEEDIEWLSCRIPIRIDKKKKTATFEVNSSFRKKYFERKFSEFKDIANNMTIESYLDDWQIYGLKKSIEDIYGFHVIIGDTDKSLDNFVRTARDGKYAITGVLDYHF